MHTVRYVAVIAHLGFLVPVKNIFSWQTFTA